MDNKNLEEVTFNFEVCFKNDPGAKVTVETGLFEILEIIFDITGSPKSREEIYCGITGKIVGKIKNSGDAVLRRRIIDNNLSVTENCVLYKDLWALDLIKTADSGIKLTEKGTEELKKHIAGKI